MIKGDSRVSEVKVWEMKMTRDGVDKEWKKKTSETREKMAEGTDND
jgi:hypothetical protein